MLMDRNIAWIRKRLFIQPFTAFTANDPAATRIANATTVVPTVVTGSGNLVAWNVPISVTIPFYGRVPIDLDPQFPLGFRVCWTADVSGTNAAFGNGTTTGWVLNFNTRIKGAVLAIPSTVLDTVVPVPNLYLDSTGIGPNTDGILQWTGRGIKNFIGITRSQIEDGAFFGINAIAPGTVTAMTTAYILGVEMDYSALSTMGAGSEIDEPLSSQ